MSGFNFKKIKFDLPSLQLLVNSEGSCVNVHSSCERTLNLMPIHMKNLRASVKEILESRVTTYDVELDGIILSHKHVKVHDSVTLDDDGQFTLHYRADIYVFKPTVGSVLKGVVNKKSSDHVGCVVHSLFNVSVPRQGMEGVPWHAIHIGADVTLEVVSLNFSAQLPYIRANILSIESTGENGESEEADSGVGFQESMEEEGETFSVKKKKKKQKKKHSKEVDEISEDNIVPRANEEGSRGDGALDSSLIESTLNLFEAGSTGSKNNKSVLIKNEEQSSKNKNKAPDCSDKLISPEKSLKEKSYDIMENHLLNDSCERNKKKKRKEDEGKNLGVSGLEKKHQLNVSLNNSMDKSCKEKRKKKHLNRSLDEIILREFLKEKQLSGEIESSNFNVSGKSSVEKSKKGKKRRKKEDSDDLQKEGDGQKIVECLDSSLNEESHKKESNNEVPMKVKRKRKNSESVSESPLRKRAKHSL